MSTHNMCFYGEIRKLSQNYHQILLLNSSAATIPAHVGLVKEEYLVLSDFVCVYVLRPSQPDVVMSNAASFA